jgi:hypothetical protein
MNVGLFLGGANSPRLPHCRLQIRSPTAITLTASTAPIDIPDDVLMDPASASGNP